MHGAVIAPTQDGTHKFVVVVPILKVAQTVTVNVKDETVEKTIDPYVARLVSAKNTFVRNKVAGRIRNSDRSVG